jgi:hypothetical protein
MTLKEQQTIEKRQRLVIKGTVNRLKSRFSLQQIKTWTDVWKMSGYSDEWINSKPNKLELLDFNQLKTYCKKLEDDFEQQLKDKYAIKEVEVKEVTAKQVLSITSTVTDSNGDVLDILRPLKGAKELQEVPEAEFNNSNNYGLQPSPKEKAFLYWFQAKAAKETLDKILVG